MPRHFQIREVVYAITLNETIDIITNYAYDQNNKNQPPFSKLIFKRMLKLATGGYFMYNGKLYQQIDGVTMVQPRCCTTKKVGD